MTAIYRDAIADKRRIYDERHITTSNKHDTLSKPDKRLEDTQLVWITEKSQLGDDTLKLANAYHKRQLTIPDDTKAVSIGEASGYLVGVFVIIVSFTITIMVASILCRKWYEKNLPREEVRFRGYQIQGRKVKPNKGEDFNSQNPLEIKVEISEKIERDDNTIIGVPSPTFPTKDRYSFSTTHSSLSEATRYSRVESFYALNEKGDLASLVSLRIPPRSQSRNATDQRTPLKIANIQLEPISSVGLGWSGLSPPDGINPKRSLLLLSSSSGHDAQTWLYEDAFNGEYHDVVKFNQNTESERSFSDTQEYGQGGKFTNRLTFGVSPNIHGNEGDSDLYQN